MNECAEISWQIDELRTMLVPELLAEDRFVVLAQLGLLLSRRYKLGGDPADGAAAIEALLIAEETPCPPDVEPAWIRLELTELLASRGERNADLGDIETAIEYGRRALAELTSGTGPASIDLSDLQHGAALCNLGIAHFLRARFGVPGAREDLREAIGNLDRAAGLVPDSHPGRGEITARLGVALAMAAWHDTTATDAEDEQERSALDERVNRALTTLDDGWRTMPADDRLRPLVRFWRALTRGIRFVSLGGGADDCETALTELAAVLGLPGRDEATADICHLYLAILSLSRAAPAEFRRGGDTPTLATAGRLRDSRGTPLPEDALAALDHLDQISDQSGDGPVPSLRVLATIAAAMRVTDDQLARALAAAEEAIERNPGEHDLHGMPGVLKGIQAARRGNQDEVVGAVTGSLEELDDDDPMRPALQGMLGELTDLTSGTSDIGGSASLEDLEATVDRLECALRELPDDHPARAPLRTQLTAALLRCEVSEPSATRMKRARELLDEAIARPGPDPAGDATSHCLLAIADGIQSIANGADAERVDDSITRLKRAADLLPSGHRLRADIATLLVHHLGLRHLQGGELEFLDAADHYARMVAEELDADDSPAEELRVMTQYQRVLLQALRDKSRLESGRLDDTLAELNRLARRIPEGHWLRQMMETGVNIVAGTRALAGPDGPDHAGIVADPARFATALDPIVRTTPSVSPGNPLHPVQVGQTGYLTALQGLMRRDLKRLDAGQAMLAGAYENASMPAVRTWLLSMLGMGLMMRYLVTRGRDDLDRAIERLEEAREATGTGDAMPLPLLLSTLAGAYRERGCARRDDGRRMGEAGIASLRARAWDVMLQSSADRAFATAVAGEGHAAEMGRWCVADGIPGTAIEAFELGRAMVLHAATTDVGLPVLLRENGHGDLASEWETAMARNDPAPWNTATGTAAPSSGAGFAELLESIPTAQLPSDLRHRVMKAIRGTETEQRLFTPATPDEIAAALGEAAARALVYLVPRYEGEGGLAVVVGTDGRIERIPLPRLTLGPRSRVATFLQAQRACRQAEPDSPERRRAHRRWRYALGDLCDWAWPAVMEPILGAVAGMPGRRPMRVIVVAIGELGVIPWHAARRPAADGSPRYACQDAVISYSASARQFIEARRYGHRPWASAAALVRVRGGDLYWASKEIEQIHRRHYPDGKLFDNGRRRAAAGRSGPATAESVRGLLPGPRAAGASLVHLGCHAESAPRPVDSHLLLDGSETLGMSEILRQARARPAGTPGGLIVLAACGSDLSNRDHDEALTLASAFLAAGAAGVVGARWSVDDLPTALFMTLFHHYLNAAHDDPAIALRATQLWMLDPGRSVPADLASGLAEEMSTVNPAEPEFWAAFTYQGQ
ncbi:MAG: CHAT domain-containing protein [Actinoallomurus sp.]